MQATKQPAMHAEVDLGTALAIPCDLIAMILQLDESNTKIVHAQSRHWLNTFQICGRYIYSQYIADVLSDRL